jgi:transcription-repair coupling factor (superfamily II helicase)
VPVNLSIFKRAVHSIQAGEERVFTSLAGSSGALLFAMLGSSSLLISASDEAASEFHSDSLFWSKVLGVDAPLLLVSGEDPDHFRGVTGLYGMMNPKVVASVGASISPLWKPDAFPRITLAKDSAVNRDSLFQKLQHHGYHTVPVVSGGGEMSVRGGILDVFSPDSDYPVRIEFFGDRIESLRLFNPDTQLSLEEIRSTQICPSEEPEEGINLLQLLGDSRVIVHEPDLIKSDHPDFEFLLPERECLHFTALPLGGEGMYLPIQAIGHLGPLRDGRTGIQSNIQKIISLARDQNCVCICSSEWQAKRLSELFSEEGLTVPIMDTAAAFQMNSSPVITTGGLSSGFTSNGTMILAESNIFGKRPAYRPIKKSRVSHLVTSMEDLSEGDYLVHIEHGIGRFSGIQRERVEGCEAELLALEYSGGDRLYVPVERINSLQKYHVPGHATPRLDRLGGKTWQRTKKRVKEKIQDMAMSLLRLHAKRADEKGHAFSGDTEMHHEFDDFFQYEETPDQLTAIEEIKKDMERPSPSDRLLCGDVGYGKTEVAMRACFRAVYDSMQVAVLVPTTILAEQHYSTFLMRFSAFPVRIDYLNRFKSRLEQKQTLKALSSGDTDIIIGTHRLLGKDVRFHNLGLLVIDEEHKFGVTHKEKIKALKTNVDILTLSATPIPRTLHMALSGIRTMSIIETPPEERLAVKSVVARFTPEIIRDALRRELHRGGQAFFIHNRIQDIDGVADFIRGLVPEGTVSVAHGRMKGSELERTMSAFYRKKVNILVSTAIIGSGLDIPSANTIIINRADTFGLADLYQIRGRVGRSNIRAYAYFLIPGEEIISDKAREKVLAIQELSYLGAGFRLAIKDLEIRGAGNLLGAEQSGHIGAVGYELYVKMLEEAVAKLKGEEITPVIEPRLELRVTAVIEEEYVRDSSIRLNLYRRMSSSGSVDDLNRLRDELRDRFGTLPEKTIRLLEIMELRLLAKECAVTKMQNNDGRFHILFAPGVSVGPETLFELQKKRDRYLRFLPQGGIELNLRGKTWDRTFRELRGILQEVIDGRNRTSG